MHIRSATFLTSNTSYDLCPPAVYPEYAFCGRSNVGKSSLINMLTNVKGLAKTSSTPGKTQLINHFLINEQFYVTDLPGYGFAKSSRENREKWGSMTREFLRQRKNMMCLFLLIDSRVTPQQNDLDFISFLGENGVPFVLTFTKADKISAKILTENVDRFKNKLLESWETLPEIFITSSAKKKGRDEILSFIDKTNKLFVLESKK